MSDKIDNDIVARLEDGFGSAAGQRAQINAYHKLCLAAAAEIKDLRAALAKREAVAVPEARLITDASELEVGKTYWVKPAIVRHGAYQPRCCQCGESGGWKYIAWPTDASRMWADECNDQFTGLLVAFGPCDPPRFPLAASQQAKGEGR